MSPVRNPIFYPFSRLTRVEAGNLKTSPVPFWIPVSRIQASVMRTPPEMPPVQPPLDKAFCCAQSCFLPRPPDLQAEPAPNARSGRLIPFFPLPCWFETRNRRRTNQSRLSAICQGQWHLQRTRSLSMTRQCCSPHTLGHSMSSCRCPPQRQKTKVHRFATTRHRHPNPNKSP